MFLLLQHIFLSSIISLLIHPSQDSDVIKLKYDSVISLLKICVCVQHCLQDSSSESTAQHKSLVSWLALTSFPPYSLHQPSPLSCILCIYDSVYCSLCLVRPILSSFCVIIICPISSANPATACLNYCEQSDPAVFSPFSHNSLSIPFIGLMVYSL